MDSISRLPLCNHLLQQTLRGVCVESEWVYCVFWRILPRNFPPPKWELGGYLERSKANKRNWILVWEDGFCDFARSKTAHTDADNAPEAAHAGGGDIAGPERAACRSTQHAKLSDTLHPELFFKMSHEIYNYGEGLMGKVAADNGHKWIYRDPPERDNRLVSFWHNTIDPQPRTWEAQFKCGIQTIVVVAVHEGLVQLGSNSQVLEDLNFVVMVQRKFNSLQQVSSVVVVPDIHKATSSLERKMKHARPDYDDEDQTAFSRTLERRLSWSSSLADSRHAGPPPPPFSPSHYDRYNFFQQQLPLPLSRDVQAAADHLSNSTSSSVLPPAGLHDQQGASHVELSQVDYHGHRQLRLSCCSNSTSAAISSCAAAVSTCSGPLSALPSMSTLQALLSKLPAVTSTSLLDQQSINSKSLVQNHSPLLRTLSASAPAAHCSTSSTTYPPVVCASNELPDSAWPNVTSSCDQLLSFHPRMIDDHRSFLATSLSPQQPKIEQGEADTVANYQSRTVDQEIKGMVQLQTCPLAREPGAAAATDEQL